MKTTAFEIWSNDDELRAYGATPYKIAGRVFWFKWLAPGQYDTSRVDPAIIAQAVARHSADPSPFIIDIEDFDLYGDRPNALENLNLAADAWKATNRPIGFYGILPDQEGHYWTCASYVNDPTPEHVARYEKWQRQNDDNWRELRGDQLDFLCPSLYAFYKPKQGGYGTWKAHAAGLLDEAKRLAGSLPVYPFMWPVYHPSAAGGSTAISPDEWAEMVDYVASYPGIAGMVIWNEPTDTPADTWREPLMPIANARRTAVELTELLDATITALADHEAAKQRAKTLIAELQTALASLAESL